MRISQVMTLARQYMVLGIIGAFITISLFLIGYFLVYKKLMKGNKKLKASKLGLWSVFFIYIIIVLGATIGDRFPGFANVNLHLFSSYKDAYNSFSLREWRNIILNILMFAPIGFMLPLIFKKCEKWYITYLTGFVSALFIETLQLISKRGIFELDDIVNNTLGCIIGYGIVMICKVIFRRKSTSQKSKGLTAIIYQLPLLITVISFSVIFINYSKQELGNLSSTNIYRVDMSTIDVSNKLSFDNKLEKAYVYEAQVGSKEDATSLANHILSKVNTKIDSARINEYDDTIVFESENGSYGLWVDYKGLTTWFIGSSQTGTEGKENLTYKEVQALLSNFDIDLPEEADFKDNGKGEYSISMDMVKYGEKYLNGVLTCTIDKNGIVTNFKNNIISCKPYKEYEILSLKEAYDNILAGEFKMFHVFGKNSKLEIIQASLTYKLDSKGFYQPVYDFKVNINGEVDNISIAALRNN
ncbi:VanZ family protein [Clostridium tunisiense]|uniref:VanZ family protein n=1 Tax=Clostridium tunisiense TaxID=219748 RepID=UPI00031B5961|nr:VanZ family protein [Clostridium tunisiense]